MLGMRLGGFFVMVFGMGVMRMGEVGVMRRLFVLAVLVGLGGMAMMLRCFLVVLGSVFVMLGGFVGVFHDKSPSLRGFAQGEGSARCATAMRRIGIGLMTGFVVLPGRPQAASAGAGCQRAPKMALPTRTWVAPMAMAVG